MQEIRATDESYKSQERANNVQRMNEIRATDDEYKIAERKQNRQHMRQVRQQESENSTPLWAVREDGSDAENEEAAASNESSSRSVFTMNHDDLKQIEQEWCTNPKSYDVSKSLDDAMLMYYLNSGYARFDEHKSYDKNCEGETVNCKEVMEEIEKERLSDKELVDLIETYFQAHDFNAAFYGCGACGIRQLESNYGSASIEYNKVHLSNLSQKHYRLTAKEESDLEEMQAKGPIEIEVPGDSDEEAESCHFDQVKLEPWKIKSYYRSSDDNCLYHLHQELISRDDSNKEYTMFCPRCYKAHLSGECYKLSIAAGVDFGNYKRVKGLVKPNLHEQLILSKYRLYCAAIKVTPNGRGFQQSHGMNAMRGNQILFAHDAPHKVCHAGLEESDLRDLLEVNFLNEKDSVDQMAKRALGSSKLYARIHVLRQWFAVLHCISPQYSDITPEVVDELLEKVGRDVVHRKSNPQFTTDSTSLRYEKALGSDVTGAQQIDAMTSRYNDMNGLDEEPQAGVHQLVDDRDELPIRTHYVSHAPEAHIRDYDQRKSLEIEGFVEMVKPKLTNNSLESQEENDGSDNNSATDEWLEQEQAFWGIEAGEEGSGKVKGIIQSRRMAEPANEMNPTDELLTSTFPCVFPCGVAYNRRAGNLSNEQLYHLLQQFHLVPCTDSRLLGYLGDVKRRFEVIKNTHIKTPQMQKAQQKVNDFTERKDHAEILQKLKDNPEDPEAKRVWKEFRSILELIGGNVMYGALESSRCMSQTFETAKRYGQGCVFLTLSFDDMNNTRGIRASIETVSNEKFPTSFDGDGFGSLSELVEEIKKQSVFQGEGTIPYGEGPGLNFQKSRLARLAMENPVAYVAETKLILNHVLTILLGCPPEGFFGAFEGPSSRKTEYFKNRKGIIGHLLALAGVCEDHTRGTLHFHIILFGSISAYVLHEMAGVADICKKVAEVLDSFYQAKFSTQTNFRNVLTREIRKATGLTKDIVEAERLSPPALLNRVHPLQHFESNTSNNEESPPPEMNQQLFCLPVQATLEKVTCNERAASHFHEHGFTCRKGFYGKCQCRLAKKSGLCDGTHSVLLEPTTNDAPKNDDSNDEDEKSCDDFESEENRILEELKEAECENSLVDRDEEISLRQEVEEESGSDMECFVTSTEEQEAKSLDLSDLDQKYHYAIRSVPANPEPTYQLRNPMERKEKDIIVWELDRPTPDLKGIAGFEDTPGCTLLTQLELSDEVRVDENKLRRAIFINFKKLLCHEPGTVGHPFDDTSKLWSFLRQDDIRMVTKLYDNVVNALKTSNQYAVEHNVPLFYCTGSHNNTVMLGASEQAKAAMFYMAPYMSKEKASLSACLTILEKARKEIAAFPSKAKDREDKPTERTTKHFLCKVVNKLNAYTELSDYQVAAYLLHIPSILTSEVFQFSEPHGAMNYRRKYLCAARPTTSNDEETSDDEEDNSSEDENEEESNTDEPTVVMKSNIHNQSKAADTYLGYSRMFTTEIRGDDEEDIKKMIPVVACYFHRGHRLKDLSLHEYDAMIQTKKLPENPETAGSRSKWFLFNQDFDLAARFGQTLRAKQRTLIYKGKAPKFPGQQPPSKKSRSYKNWKQKADRYAEYTLTMFRPCEIFGGVNQTLDNDHVQQDYGWEDLIKWIKSLQEDNTVLSKFRLMAIDRRMNSLVTDFRKKKILSHYRAREADKWTDHQKLQRELEKRFTASFQKQHDEVFMDEDAYDAPQQTLSKNATNVAKKLNNDANAFAQSAIGTRYFEDARKAGGRKDAWAIECNGSDKETVMDINDCPTWEEKCDWIYQDGDLDDGTPYGMSTNVNNDTSDDEDSDGNSVCGNDAKNTPASNNGTNNQSTKSNKESLNEEQLDIVELYKDYLKSTQKNSPGTKLPPKIVLLTGKGGTGKSFVIHELLELGNKRDKNEHGHCTVLTMANNNLNAADINGCTIASLLHQRIEKDGKIWKPRKLIPEGAVAQLQKNNIHEVRLLIIDEVSNIRAEKLGELSRLFGLALQNTEEPFGGIPVLLVGDYNQKKPVGELATKSLMELETNSHRLKTTRKSGKNSKKEVIRKLKTKQKPLPKSDALFSTNKCNAKSDHAIGCQILAAARWHELTKAERSKDDKHNDHLERLYSGQAIRLEDLLQYEIFSEERLKQDDEPEQLLWLIAPVVVKNNRERITINYLRAIQFAEKTKKYLFRWSADWSNWEDKPPYSECNEIMDEDPAFWEIFVKGGPCYLTSTICKKKKLCNGTRAKYDSLLLDDESLREFKRQAKEKRTVITLPHPPLGINITIDDNDIVQTRNWNGFLQPSCDDHHDRNNKSTEHPKCITIPIRTVPKRFNTNEKPVYIVPSSYIIRPSRVKISPHFPICGGFAITVDKAQGQTLDRVIVALSSRELELCNFKYAGVYVALSRVREAKHLRLLLKGENTKTKWDSLQYLLNLQKCESIDAYFNGFNESRANWTQDIWNLEKALQSYQK